jgi:AcrR family transcriptional regulator
MPTKRTAPSEGTAPGKLTATLNGVAPAPDGLTVARDGLGPECMVEIQRARVLAAMTEVACERGAGNATIAHVVQRAGVSRRTFYELFADREDCLLAAFDEGIARVSRYVLDSYDPGAKWVDRVRAALVAVLRFLDTESATGRFLIVASPGAGTATLERRRGVFAQMIAIVDEGRKQSGSGGQPSSAGGQPSSLLAEGVVGGVLSVLARLIDGDHPPLVGFTGQLMRMIVLPYLGPAAAKRELSRHVVVAPVRVVSGPANPLKDLEMRLTYRTVRVLAAVTTHPGSSNRVIGDVSGISDQGQVSKLLARLGRLGLIENTSVGFPRGDPNAWTLTGLGKEVQDALGN